MPTLPRYESQISAQSNRRIITQPRLPPDTAVGEALQQAGRATVELATKIQAAKVDSELVTATRLAREKHEKAKYDLENNREIDDDQIEPTLRAEGDKIIAEVGEGISSTAARKVWTENAKNLQSDGDIWARKTAMARGVDRVKGQHVKATADLELRAGDLSMSMEAYEKNLQDQRGSIGRDRDRGILTDVQAAELNANIDKLAVKDRTIRWSSNIDTLVKAGRLAEAQAMFDAGAGEVDPQTRETVKKGLEATKQDYAVVETADTLWDKSGGDYGKFIKETAKIKDAELRVKVEDRGNKMRLQEEQARNVQQDGLEDQMWAHVEGGGTIGNAPPSLRASIDPDRLGSIRAYENARDNESTLGPSARELWVAQSRSIRNELETMLPERFVGGYPVWSARDKQRFAQMTPADQVGINEEITKRRTQGATSNAIDATYSDLVNELKRVAPENWDIGKTGQKNEATEMLGVLRGYAKDQASAGKPITADQTRILVARAMSSKGRLGKPADIIFNDIIRQGMEGKVKTGAIDPDTVADIEDTFYRNTGRAPTAQETMALYEKVQAAAAGTAEAPY